MKLAIFLALTGTTGAYLPQGPTPEATAAIQKIQGVYAGQWTMYRLGEQGTAVPAATWQDTLTSAAVSWSKTEAAVTVNAVMRFDNPRIPVMKFATREGYTLDAKGRPQAYFIDTNGQRAVARELGDNIVAYNTKAEPAELARLGLGPAKEAWHTFVKAVVQVQGAEVHKITRLTTAVLPDGTTVQFVSLSGAHRKIKALP